MKLFCFFSATLVLASMTGCVAQNTVDTDWQEELSSSVSIEAVIHGAVPESDDAEGGIRDYTEEGSIDAGEDVKVYMQVAQTYSSNGVSLSQIAVNQNNKVVLFTFTLQNTLDKYVNANITFTYFNSDGESLGSAWSARVLNAKTSIGLCTATGLITIETDNIAVTDVNVSFNAF